MKRLVLSYSVALATTVLLTSCYSQKNTTNTALTNQSQGAKMERSKTNSGLEYEIIQEGTGRCPARGNIVTVHYTGWLNENGKPGKKFDSSIDRGQPFQFNIGIGQVIRGWDEGVMSMKIGEKRRLFIPSVLGYGAYGAGQVIPPHADLIFDVELLNIL